MLDPARHTQQQIVQLEWLGEAIGGLDLRCLNVQAQIALCGDHDYGDLRCTWVRP